MGPGDSFEQFLSGRKGKAWDADLAQERRIPPLFCARDLRTKTAASLKQQKKYSRQSLAKLPDPATPAGRVCSRIPGFVSKDPSASKTLRWSTRSFDGRRLRR